MRNLILISGMTLYFSLSGMASRAEEDPSWLRHVPIALVCIQETPSLRSRVFYLTSLTQGWPEEDLVTIFFRSHINDKSLIIKVALDGSDTFIPDENRQIRIWERTCPILNNENRGNVRDFFAPAVKGGIAMIIE